jgi:hypothetical protein
MRLHFLGSFCEYHRLHDGRQTLLPEGEEKSLAKPTRKGKKREPKINMDKTEDARLQSVRTREMRGRIRLSKDRLNAYSCSGNNRYSLR